VAEEKLKFGVAEVMVNDGDGLYTIASPNWVKNGAEVVGAKVVMQGVKELGVVAQRAKVVGLGEKFEPGESGSLRLSELSESLGCSGVVGVEDERKTCGKLAMPSVG